MQQNTPRNALQQLSTKNIISQQSNVFEQSRVKYLKQTSIDFRIDSMKKFKTDQISKLESQFNNNSAQKELENYPISKTELLLSEKQEQTKAGYNPNDDSSPQISKFLQIIESKPIIVQEVIKDFQIAFDTNFQNNLIMNENINQEIDYQPQYIEYFDTNDYELYLFDENLQQLKYELINENITQ